MRDIYLYGAMAEKYGNHFRLDVKNPAEAVRALCVQLPGFREDMVEHHWHVVRGSDLDDPNNYLSKDTLEVGLGRDNEIHFMPAVEGSKDGGLFQTIAGAVLITIGVFVPGMQPLIYVGAGMMISGAAQMMASTPQTDYASNEKPDQRPSFLFKGAVNTSTQGIPVPVIYGRMRVGSSVISAGMSVEEV